MSAGIAGLRQRTKIVVDPVELLRELLDLVFELLEPRVGATTLTAVAPKLLEAILERVCPGPQLRELPSRD